MHQLYVRLLCILSCFLCLSSTIVVPLQQVIIHGYFVTQNGVKDIAKPAFDDTSQNSKLKLSLDNVNPGYFALLQYAVSDWHHDKIQQVVVILQVIAVLAIFGLLALSIQYSWLTQRLLILQQSSKAPFSY